MGDLLIMSKKELKRKGIFDLIKNGCITQKDASKRLGISYRQTRRSYQRYLQEGDLGLIHRSRGKASHRAIPFVIKQKVLELYEEKYWDFGPTLASEKLLEEDNINIHAETLRTWLKKAGIWLPRRKRKEHRAERDLENYCS
jgi:transposase